jgi:uncharacterized protein YoxC
MHYMIKEYLVLMIIFINVSNCLAHVEAQIKEEHRTVKKLEKENNGLKLELEEVEDLNGEHQRAEKLRRENQEIQEEIDENRVL